jgi:hypothetical protein
VSSRDFGGDAELLSRFAAQLDGGGFPDEGPEFEPELGEPMWASALPGRVGRPGVRDDGDEETDAPRGPRSVILDCGISRLDGYTHVLWISTSAEAVLGSDGFARLGEIVGRVYGVTSYQWESIDRLHLAAGDIAWADLLAESREALAVYMAGRV